MVWNFPPPLLKDIHTADMEPPRPPTKMHLRSLEGRQNVGLLLLLRSCNGRSCTLGLDQIKNNRQHERNPLGGPFLLTLN